MTVTPLPDDDSIPLEDDETGETGLEPGQTEDTAVSAYDRVQDPSVDSSDGSGGVSWSWLGGLVFLILGVVGVWFWVNRETDESQPDLYRLAVGVAREFRPVEITDDPDRAASYVLENFGLPLFPPELDGFGLLGVGSAELVPGVFVPAFRYDGSDNSTVVIFVYDYIFLDEAASEGLVLLAPEAYARLAEPEPVDSRRVDDAYVVSWRRRATIFTAVAPGVTAAEMLLQSVRRAEI